MSDRDFDLVHDQVCLPLVQSVRTDPNGPADDFFVLTPEEQAFLAMWHLEGQVFNGGFFQFYFNMGGWLAEYALRGYEMAGLSEHAEFVRKAISIAEQETAAGLPDIQVPTEGSPELRAFTLFGNMARASRLSELDDPWYALDRRSDPYAVKAVFVRAHPDRFPHAEFS